MPYNIEYFPIDALKVNPDNPRLIKDKEFKKLVKSLKDCPKLFNARPCICSDRTGELKVLAGNMRLAAARELKYKEVPTIVMQGLTEAQEREIAIKDNGRFGDWDFDILANGWDDLPLDDWGIDLPDDWTVQDKSKLPNTNDISLINYRELSPLELDNIILEKIEDSDHIVFMFSGGRDSALTLASLLPTVRGKSCYAIYVDTGTEFPDLIKYVYDYCKVYQVNLKILKPDKNFFEVYEPKKKFPDPIYRDCIESLINKTSDKFFRSLDGKVLCVRGGRSKQKTSRSKNDLYVEYKKTNEWTLRMLNPIMYISDDEYNKRISELTLWDGYKKGFKRTACWCCPFHGSEQYEALKINYPMCWEALREMARTWEYPSHQGDGNIKRWHDYWNKYL